MTRNRIDPEFGPTSQQLAAFADGELSAPAREAVQAWLATRPDARAEVEANRALLRAWRASPPDEPSPEAWERVQARIAAGASSGPGPIPLPRPRPRWALRVVGALVATAALVGGALLARALWAPVPPDEPPVAVQSGPPATKPPAPKVLAKNEDEDESFPVMPASEGEGPLQVVSAAEVHILNMEVRDADAVAIGQPKFLDTFVLASPRDIEVLAVGPPQPAGPMPRLEEGAVPMIVFSALNRAP